MNVASVDTGDASGAMSRRSCGVGVIAEVIGAFGGDAGAASGTTGADETSGCGTAAPVCGRGERLSGSGAAIGASARASALGVADGGSACGSSPGQARSGLSSAEPGTEGWSRSTSGCETGGTVDETDPGEVTSAGAAGSPGSGVVARRGAGRDGFRRFSSCASFDNMSPWDPWSCPVSPKSIFPSSVNRARTGSANARCGLSGTDARAAVAATMSDPARAERTGPSPGAMSPGHAGGDSSRVDAGCGGAEPERGDAAADVDAFAAAAAVTEAVLAGDTVASRDGAAGFDARNASSAAAAAGDIEAEGPASATAPAGAPGAAYGVRSGHTGAGRASHASTNSRGDTAMGPAVEAGDCLGLRPGADSDRSPGDPAAGAEVAPGAEMAAEPIGVAVEPIGVTAERRYGSVGCLTRVGLLCGG